MAIANVVCRGFGPAASIAFIVTRGYSLGAEPPPPPPPPPPVVQSVIPHDDYDDVRPWWDRRRNLDAEQQQLAAMRAEIGLLPKRQAREIERTVATVVSKATVRLAKSDKAGRISDEAHAFDLVAAYEREYRRALRSVLSQARADDLVETFRAEVRASLREEQRQRVEADDAEILQLVEQLI